MEPRELLPYDGQFVEVRFADGERVRAHIVSIDPEALDNHLCYELLEIVEAGPLRARMPKIGEFICDSAQNIITLTPTGSEGRAPRTLKSSRPWWKLW